MGELLEVFNEFQVEVIELIDIDDRVVALVRYKGRGSATGLAVEGAGVDAQIWTLRQGKAVQVETYSGTIEALEAVGLKNRCAP
jgi:ketosteroid isomerase-like protein